METWHACDSEARVQFGCLCQKLDRPDGIFVVCPELHVISLVRNLPQSALTLSPLVASFLLLWKSSFPVATHDLGGIFPRSTTTLLNLCLREPLTAL